MCAFIRVVYTLCTFDFLIFPRLAQFEMDCQTVRARDRLIPGGMKKNKKEKQELKDMSVSKS